VDGRERALARIAQHNQRLLAVFERCLVLVSRVSCLLDLRS
jgi:hypothetical protein